MAWWNPLSWTDKLVDNVLDKNDGIVVKAVNRIDELSYTEQEKIEDNKELRKAVIDYAVASMDENSERSKARREIAKLWIKAQLSIVLMCCICAPWDMDLAEFYFKLGTSGVMIAGTGAIITFFFGSYLIARNNTTKK